MKSLRFFLLSVFFCLILISRSLWADGIIRDSVSATSAGRGSTNLGHFDNAAILLNNPAAMVNIRGTRLDEFGIDAFLSHIAYADPENSAAAKIRPGALPEFATIRRSEDGQWAFGLGIFSTAGFATTWELKNPLLGSNGYNSFGAFASILPGLAYRVNDRLSFGANFGVAVGHAELDSPFFFQTGILAGTPTSLDLQATGAALTGSFGLQYRLNDLTTIGAVYQSETRFDLDGSAMIDVFGLGPQPIRSRFDAEVNLVLPRSFGVGLTHDLDENRRFSFDVVWFDWSGAFDRVDIAFTNSSNPFFTGLLGPKITDTLPLNWKDSVSFRFGYEVFHENGDVFRIGYIHNTEQTPSSTLTPLIPAVIEHIISLGYGTCWKDYSLNFAYQYSFGPKRRVGNSALLGGDFSFSKIDAEGHWLSLNLIREF